MKKRKRLGKSSGDSGDIEEAKHWKELLEGRFQGHEAGVYVSRGSAVLTALFEKGKPGVAIEVFKVFASGQNLQGFADTLKREVMVIGRHGKPGAASYMLLGSGAGYVYKPEEMFRQADAMLAQLQRISESIVKRAASCDIELRELENSGKSAVRGFFVQPMLFSSMLESAKIITARKGIFPEIALGRLKDGKVCSEPLAIFRRTLVSNGNEGERNYALRILAEGFAMQGIPVLVAGWGGKFGSIAEAGDSEGLADYGIAFDRIGFPAKSLKIGSDIGVDMGRIDVKGMLELFGVGEGGVARAVGNALEGGRANAVEKALKGNSAKSMKDVIDGVKRQKAGMGVSNADINKAVRILSVISLRYPNLFERSRGIGNGFAKVKGFGVVSLLNLGEVDGRGSLMLLYSLLRQMLDEFSAKGKENSAGAVVVIPELHNAVNVDSDSRLALEISDMLLALQDYGIMFAVSAERGNDFPKAMKAESDVGIEIVSGRDAAMRMRHRKPYRFRFRESVSKV